MIGKELGIASGMWRFPLALVLTLIPASGWAQEAAEKAQATFRSGVDLIEVYATVLDRRGAPVRGLTRDRFRVVEDGVPQRVETFAVGEFPLTVILGVDRSWSMAGRPLDLAKRASQAFLGRLGTADRSMVLAIGTDVEDIAPVTWARAAQITAATAVTPLRWVVVTALGDCAEPRDLCPPPTDAWRATASQEIGRAHV